MAKASGEQTPLMQQYYAAKAQYPDALLLYRMGDFYETFGEDAITAARILGITLTKRSHGSPGTVELAGFPHHSIDAYLPKLVRAGQRVAICEQLEDPKKTNKLVKRGVTELITPGLSYNGEAFECSGNVFLASVFPDREFAGLSLLDLSTGEFFVAEDNAATIEKILNSFRPREVLYPKGMEQAFATLFGSKFYTYPVEPWFFDAASAEDRVKKHFEVTSLKGFGIQTLERGVAAAGSVLAYLEMTRHEMVGHITSISRIDEADYLLLDRFTLRNLEVLDPLHGEGASLVDVVNRSVTPMGQRLLHRWLAMPLKTPDAINERLDVVETLAKDEASRAALADALRTIGDLERLASKIAVGRLSPREMVHLKVSLQGIAPLRARCLDAKNPVLERWMRQLDDCDDLSREIERQLNDRAPAAINKGEVIAPGVNAELDELREMLSNGKELLARMQQREIENTGIPSLKISFNSVFGYFIEVTKANMARVPATWIRKQTLANAERYITAELKSYEEKILGAGERILELETALYGEMLRLAFSRVKEIQANARVIARVDALLSFAGVSVANNYCRPVIDDSFAIDIKAGRHPVIEQQLPPGESYVPNDLYLDNERQQIIVITGPNMAGKSALLRQTALIVILAQAGCFVPANAARIGYLDKVFTRVGASDNISLGESTFMVEMNEAAAILNGISDRSLVLFDELGRGTSTYDGISIAWAIVEYLHEHPRCRAKTLFATHYHELNEMERSFKKIKNYNVSVREVNQKIVFLRALVEGGSNHSFGIQVGKMAGLPRSVIQRATEILKQLENDKGKEGALQKNVSRVAGERGGLQLTFFQMDDPVLIQIRDEIAGLDINALTPLEALNKLNEIKRITGL
ncbi:MAG: DNA mismatch repair protein MutS [Odoribacteraceae bacterium]|jgi:DNA mismatch repair protein MutS|nr:DNA mismatch repair protein MutS [Odoribacteraceae bacterium]